MKSDFKYRMMRRLNWVPRWVIFPTHRNQSVAEHSYGVATIAMWLMDNFHQNGSMSQFRLSVLTRALEHDADEAITGDSPSPTKHKDKEYYMSLSQEDVVVKMADCLEAWLFLSEELRMGNNYTQTIHIDLKQRMLPYWERFNYMPVGKRPSLQSFIMHFEQRWMQGPKKEDHPIIERMNEGVPF